MKYEHCENKYFLELDYIQFELSKLLYRKLSFMELEYRKSLIKKIEEISREIIKDGKINEIYELRKRLKSYVSNYDINIYYKFFKESKK